LRVLWLQVKDDAAILVSMSVAAIILAAGASSRLGQPKQLLAYRGETLLSRAIRLAQESGASPVISVLGAHFDSILASIQSHESIPVHNDRWRQGIASSIDAGLRALQLCAPEAEGALLMSCDQPRLTADHLRALIDAFTAQSSPAIAASSYAGVHGIPAAFPSETFADLRALRGGKGARSLIERAPCPVIGIEFTGGEVDIDLPEDIALLE
jgi:molybdenum cofactor cytidylyltransferase